MRTIQPNWYEFWMGKQNAEWYRSLFHDAHYWVYDFLCELLSFPILFTASAFRLNKQTNKMIRNENYKTQLILVLNGQTKCWVVSVPFSWRPLLGLRFPLWIAWWVGYKPELCRLKPLLLLLRVHRSCSKAFWHLKKKKNRTNYVFQSWLVRCKKQIRKGTTIGNAIMKERLCNQFPLQSPSQWLWRESR